MIAIYQVTLLIHKNNAVRIAIKDDAKVGIILLDQRCQIIWMRAHMLRACHVVDVGASGGGIDGSDVSSQP